MQEFDDGKLCLTTGLWNKIKKRLVVNFVNIFNALCTKNFSYNCEILHQHKDPYSIKLNQIN